MATVAGVDCSTQSTKVVVCDADTGELLAQRSAAQKPAGLEKAQAVPVPRVEEISAIAIMQLFCDLFARGVVGPVFRDSIVLDSEPPVLEGPTVV